MATTEDTERQSLARAWRYDPQLEDALRLATERPATFAQLPTWVQGAVVWYRMALEAARDEGLDVGSPRIRA